MTARPAARAFVVDTCIARSAAGRASADPQALEGEYLRQENMSRFFRRWFGAMVRIGQVERLDTDPLPYRDVRAAMKRLIPADAHHIVKKDLHLVSAAMATDERVLSDDDKVRAHLSTIAAEVPPLARVHWADPSEPACLPWLARGAPDEQRFQLASRRP